jgi:hypothetical protein
MRISFSRYVVIVGGDRSLDRLARFEVVRVQHKRSSVSLYSQRPAITITRFFLAD